jgi:hypothetical protein
VYIVQTHFLSSHNLYRLLYLFSYIFTPSGRTGPGVDSASNRNEYQESLKIKKPGGKVWLARRADNLADQPFV